MPRCCQYGEAGSCENYFMLGERLLGQDVLSVLGDEKYGAVVEPLLLEARVAAGSSSSTINEVFVVLNCKCVVEEVHIMSSSTGLQVDCVDCASNSNDRHASLFLSNVGSNIVQAGEESVSV